MTMKSADLIPALRQLPADYAPSRRTFREYIHDLLNTDRSFYAAESAVGGSVGFWTIFDRVNVDDHVRETMTRAHEMAMPGYDGTLTEHWKEMVERGSESMTGFISNLKGKYAELEAVRILERNGYTNVRIAENPTQPVWDISATNPEGQQVFIQAKTGGIDYAYSAENLMEQHPDVHYAVSSEIYEKVSEDAPELADRMTDIGSDYLRVTGMEDGLETLRYNQGIDMPDGLGEVIPYAAGIVAGARLILEVVRTEREFKAVERSTRNKIHVVQTLTLMSRMGISVVLSAAGGIGGTSLGSAIPGVGNLVGGITGTVAGAGMGMYLNRHLQPKMLDLALNITGLTHDDLFYFKNKQRIDDTALNIRDSATRLEASVSVN